MERNMKRGLTYAESIVYAGVKRRTFDEVWKPKLIAIQQGNCRIYDVHDLDRVFDDFKREALNAANHTDLLQNAARNGRPNQTKGSFSWANKRGASTPPKQGLTTSTSNGGAGDFSSVASRILTMRKDG